MTTPMAPPPGWDRDGMIRLLREVLTAADQTKQNVWEIAMRLGILNEVAAVDADLADLAHLAGPPAYKAASDALAQLGVALPDELPAPHQVVHFKPRSGKP